MAELSIDSTSLIDSGPVKNILWLNTYYYDSIPYSIENMNSNIVWKSGLNKPEYVDIYLEFLFQRFSELEFRVTCIQTPSISLTSSNYHLLFYCSVNVFRNSFNVFQMSNSQHDAFASFLLDTSYREKYDLNKLFELKIIVKMIEYDCPLTDRYLHQESELRKLIEDCVNKYKSSDYFEVDVVEDLCNIFNVPEFKDIFTGQQNDEFAQKKIDYIRKTASSSEEIAYFVTALNTDHSQINILDIEQILNYILNEEETFITREDLIKVYFEGQLLGLNFIVEFCQFVMHGNLISGKVDFAYAIDLLLVADRVYDISLFEETAKFVYYWWRIHSYSEDFLEKLKNFNIECRFLADSLEIVLKSIKENQVK